VIQSEIFPLNVRGTAMALATLIQWCANPLVSATFLTMQNTITPQGGFWLLAFVCLCAFGFCFVFVPETKGRSLELIERALRRSHTRNMRDALRAEDG
jgi:MFS transporter, SP family, galactose:H+ symporter